MLRLAIGIAAAVVLTGCVVAPHYDKLGASDEDTQRAVAGCKVQAAMVPDSGAWGMLEAENVRDNCMRAQGWIRSN